MTPSATTLRPAARAAVRVAGSTPTDMGILLRRAWQERALVGYFGRRFNEKRYMRTWLGRWWLLLRPGLTIAWQMFVFILIAPVDFGTVPFPVAFLVAFATWTFFSETAIWATRSLELNRRVLRTVAVSPVVMVVAALAPALIDLAITAGFLVVTLLVFLVVDGQLHVTLSPASIFIVGGFALLAMLAFGIGLALAVSSVRFRDARFGLAFVFSLWYFATPVIYPLSAAPDGVRTLIELNPLTAPVSIVRHGLLGTPGPSLLALASACVLTLLAVVLGFRRFARGHGAALDHV